MDQINIKYLLVGVGDAIFLFLLILVMQLYKNANMPTRKLAVNKRPMKMMQEINSQTRFKIGTERSLARLCKENKSVQCCHHMFLEK